MQRIGVWRRCGVVDSRLCIRHRRNSALGTAGRANTVATLVPAGTLGVKSPSFNSRTNLLVTKKGPETPRLHLPAKAVRVSTAGETCSNYRTRLRDSVHRVPNGRFDRRDEEPLAPFIPHFYAVARLRKVRPLGPNPLGDERRMLSCLASRRTIMSQHIPSRHFSYQIKKESMHDQRNEHPLDAFLSTTRAP